MKIWKMVGVESMFKYIAGAFLVLLVVSMPVHASALVLYCLHCGGNHLSYNCEKKPALPSGQQAAEALNLLYSLEGQVKALDRDWLTHIYGPKGEDWGSPASIAPAEYQGYLAAKQQMEDLKSQLRSLLANPPSGDPPGGGPPDAAAKEAAARAAAIAAAKEAAARAAAAAAQQQAQQDAAARAAARNLGSGGTPPGPGSGLGLDLDNEPPLGRTPNLLRHEGDGLRPGEGQKYKPEPRKTLGDILRRNRERRNDPDPVGDRNIMGPGRRGTPLPGGQASPGRGYGATPAPTGSTDNSGGGTTTDDFVNGGFEPIHIDGPSIDIPGSSVFNGPPDKPTRPNDPGLNVKIIDLHPDPTSPIVSSDTRAPVHDDGGPRLFEPWAGNNSGGIPSGGIPVSTEESDRKESDRIAAINYRFAHSDQFPSGQPTKLSQADNDRIILVDGHFAIGPIKPPAPVKKPPVITRYYDYDRHTYVESWDMSADPAASPSLAVQPRISLGYENFRETHHMIISPAGTRRQIVIPSGQTAAR